jgi:PHD/YefM family antitoxin component YafN of YafNO toxin-antitoxin module
MPHIRTKAPNGDRIVILPEADYDRMIEAAEDLRDIGIGERRISEIEHGESEFLTSC